MTPIEVTVKTLAEHAMDATVRGPGGWVGICMCGHETMTATNIRAMDQRHAAHQARVLAAAGLILVTQEWGVDEVLRDGTRENWPRLADTEAHARALAGRPLSHQVVVSRGVTEWKEAE